jgi:hypothetical protein
MTAHQNAPRAVLARQAKQAAKPSERLHRDPLATSPRHERIVELKHHLRQAHVDARVSFTSDPGSMQGLAGALDELLEAHRRPMPVANANDLAGAIPERMKRSLRHRSRFTRPQPAPRAVDDDLEVPCEHLVLLDLVRMYVRRRWHASRRQDELHLDVLTTRLSGWPHDDVRTAVRHIETVADARHLRQSTHPATFEGIAPVGDGRAAAITHEARLTRRSTAEN